MILMQKKKTLFMGSFECKGNSKKFQIDKANLVKIKQKMIEENTPATIENKIGSQAYLYEDVCSSNKKWKNVCVFTFAKTL